jgi:hypothetical protein
MKAKVGGDDFDQQNRNVRFRVEVAICDWKEGVALKALPAHLDSFRERVEHLQGEARELGLTFSVTNVDVVA